MTRSLAHRGPDGEGFFEDPKAAVWLGHRRLSVIDLETGKQPMWSRDGELGVVFNGEIYNHLELRRELEDRGHVFGTDHSDTEVLLYAYREWGGALVERLNGMWAFALLDRGRRRLLLSRDRFGQKPLYWTRQGDTFVFASELHALLQHSQVSGAVSPLAVRKYFAYGYIPAPGSLFEGIQKLPGGHNLSLCLDERVPETTRWWEFSLEADPDPPPDAEQRWCEVIREKLRGAVRRRLMSDVPLGVFLSGGIDSSSIAVLAAEAKPAEPLRTYCIGFAEASFDESAHAQRAAQWVGSEHHCGTFGLDRARRLLPEVVDGLDEPMGDSSILPTSLLCREARREVTVVLGGDGADELFAGYDPFRALRWAELYQRLVPHPLHRAIRLMAARLPTSLRNMSLDFKLKRALCGLDHERRLWNPIWMGPLSPSELAELAAEPIEPELLYAEAIELWERCRGASLVDQTLQFFTGLYLQDDILTKLDRASMMHSLELRSPYLDVELVELVRRIPHRYKLRGGTGKYLLKRAMAPLLPREIIERPKKGFGIPIGQWFRSGGLGFEGGSALPALLPGCEPFLARRLEEHRRGRADHRLYLFNHWLLERHLAGLGASRLARGRGE
jgi:asparagine synthase (glutamine-hydrolysing)